ncbi:hypothetical protein ACIGXI_36335 [Kitasatospora aureofaciens]|uniref:hypothetical protein n=1 Tax=Kitasatospora aureofaciens TaxID=1894 RepID=UPI0037CAE729
MRAATSSPTEAPTDNSPTCPENDRGRRRDDTISGDAQKVLAERLQHLVQRVGPEPAEQA